METEMNAL